MLTWAFTGADAEFFDQYLADFLPDRIFDAHAHLFSHDHFREEGLPPALASMPPRLGLPEYRHYAEWLHPEARTVGGLFFGLAFQAGRQANNDFVAAEMESEWDAEDDSGQHWVGQLVVTPSMQRDEILMLLRAGDFVGLKCYHTMAKVDGPTFAAPIEAYLPEAHVRLAHELGLTITLHMVRDRALADPDNQRTIRHYCLRYPNMRLILAHAARGFNPWHTIQGIDILRGIHNVWFDTSAVTETGAFEAIIETMGHERLLYGTDFPVSHMRGRCVAVGDSFHWIYADELDHAEKHAHLQPVLIGLESLRALRMACRHTKLSHQQIQDIFYNNAEFLFDI